MDEQEKFFRTHAFFFFQCRELIRQDPRMLTAVVPKKNMLIRHPLLLGGYLDWWESDQVPHTVFVDEEGRPGLMMEVVGIPLSGNCSFCGVDEQGESLRPIRTNTLGEHIRILSECHQPYLKQAQEVEPYTLEEVYAKLIEQVGETLDISQELRSVYQKKTIAQLQRDLAYLQEEVTKVQDAFIQAKLQLHADALRPLYEHYLQIKSEVTVANQEDKAVISKLREQLRAGEITKQDYQSQVSPLNKRLNRRSSGLRDFGLDELDQFFPGSWYTCDSLEQHLQVVFASTE